MDYNYGKNLFRGVVLQTINDTAYCIKQAQKEHSEHGKVSLDRRVEMEQIDAEINSEWFATVCLLAEVDYNKVLAEIAFIKKDTKWDQFVFGDIPKKKRIVVRKAGKGA